MYTIEQIEDAIISALEPIKASLGVLTVKTYQHELDEKDLEKLVAKILPLLPAVLVMYAGSAYEEHGDVKIEYMHYGTIVCDRSLRAEDEARRGGSGNPGTYAMLSAIRDKLCGQMLSLEIYPIDILSEESIWAGNGISIYAAAYRTAQPHLYPPAT